MRGLSPNGTQARQAAENLIEHERDPCEAAGITRMPEQDDAPQGKALRLPHAAVWGRQVWRCAGC